MIARLSEAGLTANLKKCQWGQKSCEFLGHVVGCGKVSPAELKVKAVRDICIPKTKKGIRQFLGLTGYYRRFIPKYAENSFHLTEATRKTAPDRVICCDELLHEFIYLRDVLCGLPSLTLPVPADKFLLQTDASGVGLGAVLSVIREGEELPRERRYSASELEGLAVVAAVHHFQPYLISHPFIIETDHRALVFLGSAQHQNGRLARWAMKLQPYNFTIRYRPGAQNLNADVLSRLYEDAVDVSSPPPVSRQQEGGGDVMKSPHQDRLPNMGTSQTGRKNTRQC